MTDDPRRNIEALKARLYAAIRHEKSCCCGECSGGLNAVDDLAALAAAAARTEQAERALAAAARLAELPDLAAFETYECEHGATLGGCIDEDDPSWACPTQANMTLVHAALAAMEGTAPDTAGGTETAERALTNIRSILDWCIGYLDQPHPNGVAPNLLANVRKARALAARSDGGEQT